MKRHIIETICHELLAHVRQVGEPYVREMPMFDLVRDRLKERDEREPLTQSELETLNYLNLIDDKKPDYKWEKPKDPLWGQTSSEDYKEPDPNPQRTEIERGAGDDYPVVDVKSTSTGQIFIDGGFDPNSYEERIKRSKGKKTRKRPSGDEGKL